MLMLMLKCRFNALMKSAPKIRGVRSQCQAHLT